MVIETSKMVLLEDSSNPKMVISELGESKMVEESRVKWSCLFQILKKAALKMVLLSETVSKMVLLIEHMGKESTLKWFLLN